MGSERNRFDVVVIGGGPAGMSAAAWCSELGLSTLLLERSAVLGGQIRMIHNPVENYLGLRAENGAELLEHFERSFAASFVTCITSSEVSSIDPVRRKARTADEIDYVWEALVIATGVRRRVLGIPGEEEFRTRGVLESGVRDRELVRDKRVLIIGGGDAAIENALLLSNVAASVTVAHRRPLPTARRQFLESVGSCKNVTFLPRTVADEIVGNSVVTGVRLKEVDTDKDRLEPFDAVLVRIGVRPNSDVVRNIIEVDERSYIKVNSCCETSVAGIFAVGDVANPTAPTIIAAAGTGSIAAKTIYYSLRK